MRREEGPVPGQWQTVAVATRDIAAGEQLYFSYGPRPSRDFLLTWGFLPAWNARDDVIIFSDTPHALQWHRALLAPQVGLPCSGPG